MNESDLLAASNEAAANESKYNLARNLLAARAAAGKSQEELANEAGVSRATIIQLESAEGDPRLSTLVSIARALGVSIVFLMLGKEEVNAIAGASGSREADLVREQLSLEKLATIQGLLSSGIAKNAVKAGGIGATAATSAGLAAGAVGAAIGTVILPGLGTIIGAAISGLMAASAAKKKG